MGAHSTAAAQAGCDNEFWVLPHFACCLPLVPGCRIGEMVDSRPWRSHSCPLPCCPRCPVRLNSSPFFRPLTKSSLSPGCPGARWTVQPVVHPRGGSTAATRVCSVICPGRDALRRSGSRRGGSGVSIPHAAARPSPSVLARSRRCRRGGRPGSVTFNATLHSLWAVKPSPSLLSGWPFPSATATCPSMSHSQTDSERLCRYLPTSRRFRLHGTKEDVAIQADCSQKCDVAYVRLEIRPRRKSL